VLPRHAPNQRPLPPALNQKRRTENRELKPKPVFAIEPTVPTRIAILSPLGLAFSLACKFSMAADGQKDWVELYRSALMEFDRVRLPEKIDAANQAIPRRMHELLLQKKSLPEHRDLEDALRNLRSLRRQTDSSILSTNVMAQI